MAKFLQNSLIAAIFIAAAIFQSGCAVVDSIQSACKGSDLQGGCDFLFGYKDRQQDENIESNEDLLFAMSRELNKLIKSGHEAQQLQINALQTQLTQLASQQNPVEIIDPCGDKPGAYDEVLVRIDDGRLVAYFESGGTRFLTILLQNVTYQTTDSQACVFHLDSNNQVAY